MLDPQSVPQDNSREVDDIFDEIRTIMRHSRRRADEALREVRNQQHRRRARQTRAQQRLNFARHTGARQPRYTDTSAERHPLTPDLMARWAGAHAAADLAREAAAEAARDGDTARQAQTNATAQRAEQWAHAWDERLREAGVDPDSIGGRDRDKDLGEVADTDLLDQVSTSAANYAIDVDDAATAGGHRSMSELIADTEPAPEAALIAAGDSDWQTTPVPEIGASVTLDTGAQL
ncbi:MAG: hypothetical protein CME34_14850 [Gordonia sp.]|jgi:membrane protein involved in colicin uptake|uniref:hypothetical protein n=1 Tax=Gordonia sp. (in: high G+C Gram-positive bacteria) TaxID=84139 RepID=UPI000C53A2FC|nr:hypothetical protein [Gordonia sp. (in: high G+C Gram-positive bacteria)]MAU83112.1 hypothetical protein [Gordonia sp. (in: high G+C Gram-positive bacteria)]